MVDDGFMPELYVEMINILSGWGVAGGMYAFSIISLFSMSLFLHPFEMRKENPKSPGWGYLTPLYADLVKSRNYGFGIALVSYFFLPGWHKVGISGGLTIIAVCTWVEFAIRVRDILRERRQRKSQNA